MLIQTFNLLKAGSSGTDFGTVSDSVSEFLDEFSLSLFFFLRLLVLLSEAKASSLSESLGIIPKLTMG